MGNHSRKIRRHEENKKGSVAHVAGVTSHVYESREGISNVTTEGNDWYAWRDGTYLVVAPTGEVLIESYIHWTDPSDDQLVQFLGLPAKGVMVCNRKTKGDFGNHSYIWSIERQEGYAMQKVLFGYFGERTTEVGPQHDCCVYVHGSAEFEDEIWSHVVANADNGIFLPGVNDCHNSVVDAVKSVGLSYEGSPGGRFGEPSDERCFEFNEDVPVNDILAGEYQEVCEESPVENANPDGYHGKELNLNGSHEIEMTRIESHEDFYEPACFDEDEDFDWEIDDELEEETSDQDDLTEALECFPVIEPVPETIDEQVVEVDCEPAGE